MSLDSPNPPLSNRFLGEPIALTAHRLAPEVVTELDEIWFYIARESRSTDIADGFVNFITDRFILIAGNAPIGRLREDLRPALRSFPVGQYLLFYRSVDIDTLITPRGPWASRFGSVVRSIGGKKTGLRHGSLNHAGFNVSS